MLLVLAGIQQASLLPPFLPRNHAATQAKLRFQRCLLLGADRRDLVVAMIARLVERDLILRSDAPDAAEIVPLMRASGRAVHGGGPWRNRVTLQFGDPRP